MGGGLWGLLQHFPTGDTHGHSTKCAISLDVHSEKIGDLTGSFSSWLNTCAGRSS